MRWVAKSNEDEWRARVFSFLFFFRRMHFFFIFHQLRVGAKNTTFPFSILCTYSQPTAKSIIGKFFAFLYTQLTRQSSSADTKLFSSPLFLHLPPTLSVKQRKFVPRQKTFFYFYPCVQACKKEYRARNPYDVDIKRERGCD